MKKYKVMLVDDEKDVMDVIRRKINWEELGLSDPVYAGNGLEALEVAETLRPDIVMTDIKMPYMDGLELSRQLKQLYPNIRIIILSGFDEFEYAKEAVRLNAEEYILKPIDSEHLVEVFRRIKETLDQELSERQNKAMLEDYYTQSLPVLRENFFATLIQGRIPTEEIEQYLLDYQISLKGPHYAVCTLYTSTSHVPENMNYMLLFFSVRKLAEEKIDPVWQPQFFNYLGNLCMIVSLENAEDITKLTDEMDIFCRLARSVTQAVVTCGIGQVCNSLQDIPASYNGARQAVSYRVIYGSVKAINIAEIAPSENEDQDDIGETELRELFKQIKLEDSDRINETVDSYLDHNVPRSSVLSYNLFVMDLVGQLGRFARNNELDAKEVFGEDNLGNLEIQNKDQEALRTWMKNICLRMQAMIRENRSTSTKDFVKKAKEYVYEHYSDQQLNMNNLCKELGVSVSYFSTVFRKETNQTFVSFLTDVRMNKAADLLIENDEKAYIVATKVGYSDPNYFSYVFRKQFGVSPSKYKSSK